MASIRSFFRGKKNSDSLAGDPISLETLKQLIPIRNLNEEKLQSFAQGTRSEIVSAQEKIFAIGDESTSVIYLLKGRISISDGEKTFEIEATDGKAKFPVSSGIRYTATAIAKSKVSILRVSQKIMALNSAKEQVFELNIPDKFKHNHILQLFSQHFLEDELEIPSLPYIATNLRKAMQEDIGIKKAVKIIQLDPVISAKLIEVANCPLYVSTIPVKSCFEAVKRIGLSATQNLVISLTIKNVFKSSSPQIKKHLNQSWKDSLYLSSLCYVLASVSKQSNPEEALLAGLVCDLGVIPFLNFVAKLPKEYYNEEEIKQTIPVIKGVVGASILKKWGFSEEFIQVPLQSDNWYQFSEGPLSYLDIVVLSRLHDKIGKKEMVDLPAVTSIPAASKLKNITLSPENSLSILHDAKHMINDALKTLS